MKGWRQLGVGNHVHARTASRRVVCARVVEVPETWRDETGSLATTVRGDFPKVWLQIGDGEPIPVAGFGGVVAEPSPHDLEGGLSWAVTSR